MTTQTTTVPPAALAGPARPYTDDDLRTAHDAFAKAWAVHERAHPLPEECATAANVEDCCDEHGLRAALDALAAAGRITPTGGRPDVLRTIVRPRLVDLIGLIDTALLDDTTAADRHVLAVATDRTWEIEHPAGCTVHTPAGPAVICLVHDLAVEQLHGDRVPPAGRYEVEANDLGDRLCIFGRLDGPQPPPGRGCQCSTDEPAAAPAETCRCEDPEGRRWDHPRGTGLVCGAPYRAVTHTVPATDAVVRAAIRWRAVQQGNSGGDYYQATDALGDAVDALLSERSANVQTVIDETTRRFFEADGSSERVEAVRDLLAGWYAAWPPSAVTDPHEPIAWQVESLITGAESRAARRAELTDLRERLAALAALEEYIGESCRNAAHNIGQVLAGDDPRPEADRHGLGDRWRAILAEQTATDDAATRP